MKGRVKAAAQEVVAQKAQTRFAVGDMAIDPNGIVHIFCPFVSPLSMEPVIGSVSFKPNDDPTTDYEPWESPTVVKMSYNPSPEVENLRQIGKRIFGSIILVQGFDGYDDVARVISNQKSFISENFVLFRVSSDVDIDNLGSAFPLRGEIQLNNLILNHPKLFEVMKAHLAGSTLILTDELFVLLKMSL